MRYWSRFGKRQACIAWIDRPGCRENFPHRACKHEGQREIRKIVERSDEDQCYVGSAPGLIYGGCHGDDERQVFDELCQIVEDALELYKGDGKPLPPPTAGQGLARQLAGAE
jgi:hypothetical protein